MAIVPSFGFARSRMLAPPAISGMPDGFTASAGDGTPLDSDGLGVFKMVDSVIKKVATEKDASDQEWQFILELRCWV
jgi:hypothetical protein